MLGPARGTAVICSLALGSARNQPGARPGLQEPPGEATTSWRANEDGKAVRLGEGGANNLSCAAVRKPSGLSVAAGPGGPAWKLPLTRPSRGWEAVPWPSNLTPPWEASSSSCYYSPVTETDSRHEDITCAHEWHSQILNLSESWTNSAKPVYMPLMNQVFHKSLTPEGVLCGSDLPMMPRSVANRMPVN